MELDDDDGVAKFCTHYRSRLEFVCYKRGIQRDDCPDLAQDTIAAALSQLRGGNFREASSLDTWLTRILYNKIADYWRKKSRQLPCVPFDTYDGGEDEREEIAIVESTPELPMIVEQTLASLPDELRLLLLLNARDGYSAREIAPMVGRSEGRVGAMIADAKRLFRIAIRQPEDNVGPKRLNDTEE